MTGATLTEIAAAVASQNDQQGLADAFRSLFAVGTALYIPTYTRRDEVEADRVSLFYMAKAGYDPRAAPRIWKRVAQEKGGHETTSIFATHPSSWDRYQALTRLMPAAMDEYARATGGYPKDYKPPSRRPQPAGKSL